VVLTEVEGGSGRVGGEAEERGRRVMRRALGIRDREVQEGEKLRMHQMVLEKEVVEEGVIEAAVGVERKIVDVVEPVVEGEQVVVEAGLLQLQELLKTPRLDFR
jgi:hypothetical protein